MGHVSVERFGAVSVLGCEARIVRREAAFALRDRVLSQKEAGRIVLDLSEVYALDGIGLGVLMFLQKWASDRRIPLMLFNPRSVVRAGLEGTRRVANWRITSLEEVLELIHDPNRTVRPISPTCELNAA